MRNAMLWSALLQLCSQVVRALPTSSLVQRSLYAFAQTGNNPEDEPGSPAFWTKLGLSAALVLLGGAFAGLTIGLMGLDPLHLQVLAAAADDPNEKANAKIVLRLMRRGKHWVLVTLLLCNVVVNESLPIFLDSAIGGGIAAILISTATIVIFGEIIPQAVCARYGLAIGAKSAVPVQILMYILSPIAWPIAQLLDYVLGKEGPTTYKKAELKSFLQFHRNPNSNTSSYSRQTDPNALPLNDEEIGILNGVLSLGERGVTDIMTPIKDVVTLSADDLLDHATVDRILTSGYSRFPVHEPGKELSFIGILLVKRLLLYDPSTPKKVGEFKLTVLPESRPNISCFQALDYFQTGRSHLLLVSETPGKSGGALGVVTLEDIIEEIISEEIVDETDVYEDMHTKRRAKRQSTAAVMRGIVEREERLRHRYSNGTAPRSIGDTSSSPDTPFLPPTTLGETPAKGVMLDETTRLLSPINETSSSNGSIPPGTKATEIPGVVEVERKDYGSFPFSVSPPS